MSKMLSARWADFLYGKMERKNVQNAAGWARRFSIWKNGEEKYPKCCWLGEEIFYMEKWRGKMSKMLSARWADFLYVKKEE